MSFSRSTAHRVAAAGAVVVAALALSACAAPMSTTASGAASGFTGPPVPVGTTGVPSSGGGGDPTAGFNTVDLVFLQQMIPHHEQAMRLVAMAATHGASPEIQQIAAAQQAVLPNEVEQMSRSLASLGLQPPTDPINGVHAHGGGMTEADVTRLGTLSGPDFDSDFVDLLSKHTLGSVELSRGEAEQGFNVRTRELAAAIARRDSDQVLALAKLAG